MCELVVVLFTQWVYTRAKAITVLTLVQKDFCCQPSVYSLVVCNERPQYTHCLSNCVRRTPIFPSKNTDFTQIFVGRENTVARTPSQAGGLDQATSSENPNWDTGHSSLPLTS